MEANMGRARARASQIYCVRRGFFLASLLYLFCAKKKVQRPLEFQTIFIPCKVLSTPVLTITLSHHMIEHFFLAFVKVSLQCFCYE